MATLHEAHISLIEEVNNAKTEEAHQRAEAGLAAWRKGVEDAGVKLDFIGCDLHYLNRGIDRPMCWGVFLDWRPQ